MNDPLHRLRQATYALKDALLEQNMTGEPEIILPMKDGHRLEAMVMADKALCFQMFDRRSDDEGATRSLSIDGVTFRWPIRLVMLPGGHVATEQPYQTIHLPGHDQ